MGHRNGREQLLTLLHAQVQAQGQKASGEKAHLIATLGMARATFYRHATIPAPKPAEMELCCPPTARARMAQLRLSPPDGGTQAAGLRCQSQARVALDARG